MIIVRIESEFWYDPEFSFERKSEQDLEAIPNKT
jgi:hypothetical protein